jgi:hypothetical protein
VILRLSAHSGQESLVSGPVGRFDRARTAIRSVDDTVERVQRVDLESERPDLPANAAFVSACSGQTLDPAGARSDGSSAP